MTDSSSEPFEEAITAWARMIRTSQSVLSRVEDALKAAGYPPLVWYDAVLELRRAAPVGLRPFQLQEKMLLAQYNLSRLIDRLVAAGYVARQPTDQDGRGQNLKITPAGRMLLRTMWPVYRAAIQANFAAKLSRTEVQELSRILEKLRA
ncbi:MAG: MarR family winged helix-turn-helix transcriptional regulator [Proteobacteria bacterium]|nr:MarR family winged helix-turn-helix transcriptional regulator [Pseudomonadota bacterium]